MSILPIAPKREFALQIVRSIKCHEHAEFRGTPACRRIAALLDSGVDILEHSTDGWRLSAAARRQVHHRSECPAANHPSEILRANFGAQFLGRHFNDGQFLKFLRLGGQLAQDLPAEFFDLREILAKLRIEISLFNLQPRFKRGRCLLGFRAKSLGNRGSGGLSEFCFFGHEFGARLAHRSCLCRAVARCREPAARRSWRRPGDRALALP